MHIVAYIKVLDWQAKSMGGNFPDPESSGAFILFKNDYVSIYISGIKEPDVYQVIDKLKDEYGLN